MSNDVIQPLDSLSVYQRARKHYIERGTEILWQDTRNMLLNQDRLILDKDNNIVRIDIIPPMLVPGLVGFKPESLWYSGEFADDYVAQQKSDLRKNIEERLRKEEDPEFAGWSANSLTQEQKTRLDAATDDLKNQLETEWKKIKPAQDVAIDRYREKIWRQRQRKQAGPLSDEEVKDAKFDLPPPSTLPLLDARDKLMTLFNQEYAAEMQLRAVNNGTLLTDNEGKTSHVKKNGKWYPSTVTPFEFGFMVKAMADSDFVTGVPNAEERKDIPAWLKSQDKNLQHVIKKYEDTITTHKSKAIKTSAIRVKQNPDILSPQEKNEPRFKYPEAKDPFMEIIEESEKQSNAASAKTNHLSFVETDEAPMQQLPAKLRGNPALKGKPPSLA